MSFLLLRFSPYFIPLLFFFATQAVFQYSDGWLWFLAVIIILPIIYFILLKKKNQGRPVIWLAIFSLAFAVTGFAYALILENPVLISVFLIAWSLVYWLYLEAVFHYFYETSRVYIFNLRNITLYGSILIIFFLTATLVNFTIFLNLSWLLGLFIAAVVYFSIINLVFQHANFSGEQARLRACLTSLILIELMAGLMFLPLSFYVIAVIISLGYYLLIQIMLLLNEAKLTKSLLIKLFLFSALIILAVLLTATWL